MTQDEFVRLMVESGLARYVQVEKTCVSNALQRFAALVAAHEREACAKVCEGINWRHDLTVMECEIADRYAAAIRVRGEK